MAADTSGRLTLFIRRTSTSAPSTPLPTRLKHWRNVHEAVLDNAQPYSALWDRIVGEIDRETHGNAHSSTSSKQLRGRRRWQRIAQRVQVIF